MIILRHTDESNPKLRHIHTKASPLLLPRDLTLVNRWLDESNTDTDEFSVLLQPNISYDLVAQQIDKPCTYLPIAEPFTIDHDYGADNPL